MNAIYRSVYNESLGAWVAVPEFVSAKGKKSNSVVKAEQPSSSRLTVKRRLISGLLATILPPVFGGLAMFMMQGSALAACKIVTTGSSGQMKITANPHDKLSNCLTTLGNIAGGGGLDGVHYFSVNDGGTQQGNYKNDGATGVNAIAIGPNAKSSGTNAVALGVSAKATAGHATALGGFSEAASSATAVGYTANASARGAAAIGVQAESGEFAAALGFDAEAKGRQSVSIGHLSRSHSANSVAVGALAKTAGSAVAVGYDAKGTGGFSVALGKGATASNTSAIAIGASNDTVTSSAQATGVSSISIGKGSLASSTNAIAIGKDAQAGLNNNADALSIGSSASARGVQAIAVGKGAQALAKDSIAIGTGNIVTGIGSAAIGDPNYVSGAGSMVYGNSNVVNSAGTYVFGSNVNNKTPGAIAAETDPAADALKYGTTAANSVYLGDYSTASTASGIGTKNLSREYADGSTTTGGLKCTVDQATVGGLTYGGFAGATSVGAITVGAAGEERRIQNVAAGEISATSTDAINGSQLYATNNVVFNVANSTKNILGGNSALNPNGTITMTNIGGTTKNTIHEAIQYAAQGWNLIVDTGTATPVAPGGTVTLKSIDDRIILGQNNSEVTFKLADVPTINDGLKFAGDDFPTDNTKVVSRKLNEQLNILGGADVTKLSDNNIGVVYGNDSSLQVKLAKDLVGLNSTTFTDGTNTTVVNASGLTITGGPSITIGGINAGGKQITNVASGGSINVDADKFNAANMGDLSNAINNITNAGTGGGFGLSDDNGNKFMQNLGTAAQIVGDGNIKTAVVDTAGGGKALKVSLADEIKIGSDPTNQTIINQGSVTTNNLTVKGETKLGDNFHVTNAGDVHYTGPITEATHIVNKQYVDKIIDGSAGGGFGLSDDNGNKFMQNLGTAAQIIGDGSIATSVVDTATGKALQVSLSDNVNIGKAGADGKDGTLGVHGKDGSSVVINGKDGSIGATGADGKHGVSINGKDGSIGLTGPAGTTTIRTELGAPGVDGTDGITRIQYTDPSGNNHQVATLDDGLKYTGNVGSISAKLGETVNVLGGAARADTTYSTTNVTTVASGKTIEVRMADSPKFAGEVQADGGVSVSDHLTVNPGTTVNMGGNQITNVAPGTEDNHAATVGQVKGLAQNINNAYGDLSNTIEKNRREANAGTAAAMAIAGLGQPYKPGQSMVSLGTGVWRGQTGYALGVSGITDNGKWLVKGAVSGSGRGGVGGSASINYVW